jgi:DNA replication protein DnaC
MLLEANLKRLRLPMILAEHEKLAREADEANGSYAEYLLRLTELEVAKRSANAVASRIRQAMFPVHKELDEFDFSATPNLDKRKIVEMSRCQWVTQHTNCCLLGQAGTGKTHLAIALGLAACREGLRVRFYTAASLVNQMEESQQTHRLDRFLRQLDRTDLLICDELGYLSFSRSGAELLFQVFADRYERRSLLITSNLPLGDWCQVFQGERMTAALLDRLTHHCEIFELNGESFRFRESIKKVSNNKDAMKASDPESKPSRSKGKPS